MMKDFIALTNEEVCLARGDIVSASGNCSSWQ